MTTQFIEGPGIWADITDVCAGSSRVVAAVAFVGAQAPVLLPLKAGDMLVVNASQDSLLARATNPEALATYLERGVTVLSCSKLHAKVVVASRRAFIGSANASAHSNQLVEGGVLTTDTDLIRSARGFVQCIEPDAEVDDLFLAEARRIWAKGRAGGPPGSGDRTTPDQDFLRPGPFTLWLSIDPEDDALNAADASAYSSAARRSRRGYPAARFELDFETTDIGDEYQVGDVVLHVFGVGADRVVGRPCVVATPPIPRTRVRGQFQVLRSRSGDDDIPLDEVQSALNARGVKVSYRSTHRVRNTQAKKVLLGLWGIDVKEGTRGAR